MKGLLYTLLVLLAVAGVCVVTCPDKDAHSDALKDLLNTAMTSELSKEVTNEEKLSVIQYLVSNKIRLTNDVYALALKRFLNNMDIRT